MATSEDLVNQALSFLGDDPIVALSDDTERARLANRLFQPTLDAVLRAHPWNVAIDRATLTETTAPVYSWKHKFILPTDNLRILSLNEQEHYADGGDVFKLESGFLLTDSSTANIRYIKRIAAPDMDSLLFDATAFRLASAMAYPISGSTSLSQEMWGLYQARLQEARTVDGQEGSPDRTDITTLTDIR
jgi:hypothetical protein